MILLQLKTLNRKKEMKNMRNKQVQISKDLFLDVYRLVLDLEGYELDEYTKMLYKRIQGQIDAKIKAMERHDTFTEYKTTPISADREQKRQEYLDAAGVHKDWRTSKEVHFNQ